MTKISINDLPPPPAGKIGWPWTLDADKPAHELNGKYWDSNVPKITIVTPSYNQGEFIEETIRSVLLQDYPNLEYFVIDGGSNDQTTEILKKYDRWLTGWVSEKDKGQADAINKGYARATGEVFAWINSDDWYQPNGLRTVAKHFACDPDCNWIAGSVDDSVSPQKVMKRFHSRPTSLLNLLGRHDYGFHQPGMFWKRRFWTEIGKLDDSLHFSFDHDFWIRSLLKGYKPKCLDDCVAGFRYHADCKSQSKRPRFLEEDWEVLNRYESKITPEEYAQAMDWLRDYEADFLLNSTYRLLADGQRKQAMSYLISKRHLFPRLKPRRLAAGALFRVFLTGRPPSWFHR